MKLKGKKALVTGGAKRIGGEISLALAGAGVDVAVHYASSESEAHNIVDAVRRLGRRSEAVRMDLSETEKIEGWFDSLMDDWDGFDILVNSASVFPEDGYGNLTGKSLGRSMAIHVLAPLVMIRAMCKTGREACAVNILDTRVVDGDPSHASYHLGKRGLFTLTKDLAVEMAPTLRVNAVAPGLILPPEGKGEDWIDRLKSTNPLGARGTAEDVADAVLYLAAAEFVTGQIVYVDGGRHLKGSRYGH
jgi:NAD(P)-dependent dehydrogenase (short-subunit alcohol dehydrogenase family)